MSNIELLKLKKDKTVDFSEYKACIFPDFPFDGDNDEVADNQWNKIFWLFGMDIFQAQAYEDSLVKFIITAERYWGNIRKSEEEIKKMTLGQLQKEYVKLCILSDEKLLEIKKILNMRNSISHSFYRRRTEKIGTAEGRESIIKELLEMREIFRSEKDEVYWNLSLLTGEII